jgi:hypothetical protein
MLYCDKPAMIKCPYHRQLFYDFYGVSWLKYELTRKSTVAVWYVKIIDLKVTDLSAILKIVIPNHHIAAWFLIYAFFVNYETDVYIAKAKPKVAANFLSIARFIYFVENNLLSFEHWIHR